MSKEYYGPYTKEQAEELAAEAAYNDQPHHKHISCVPLQLRGEAGKNSIHAVPREWSEMARVFQAEIMQHVVHHYADVAVYPAYKGSWRVGYSWLGGNYRIEFRAWTYGVSGGWNRGTFKRYAKRSIEQVRKIWDGKSGKKVRTYARGCYLIALYRKTGLIPSHVAKAHAARLKKDFGERPDYYNDKVVQNRLTMMSSYYIRHHAQCPKCKKRGFQETILGWSCENCQHTLYDMGKEFEWLECEDNNQRG